MNARVPNLRATDAYLYELPPTLIAKTPADPADAARLMVVGHDASAIEHRTFVDFPTLLREGDVLVINETRVVRARLRGTREPGGGGAEIVLLRPASGGPYDASIREWKALVRPGRKLREKSRVFFGESAVCTIVAVCDDGTRVVRFDDGVDLETVMASHGEMPLPPYVGPGDAARAQRYQTLFARVPGSVAAPTASLHFTPRVMDALRERGVEIVPLVLDVGLGTFKPMATESIDEHAMHAERYTISQATAEAVNRAKAQGRRVVVAGTTALRALEASAAAHGGRVAAESAETSIFITPGFAFAIADALLTNFHLPASTLLVLVSAFAGYERMRAAYDAAIAERYRFYSFGDAMFIVRY